MAKQALEGKVALVTGASKGIGQAVARRLARDGAAVVVNYSSSAESARKTVADIQAAGAAPCRCEPISAASMRLRSCSTPRSATSAGWMFW